MTGCSDCVTALHCEAVKGCMQYMTADEYRAKVARSLRINVAPQWRDISSAPKDGTHITVIMPGQLPATVHWFDGGWHLSVNQMGEYSAYIWGEPTHWMPLPEAPR